MSGERIASYEAFMNILADAQAFNLCNAPMPSRIKGLAPGAEVLLSIAELGCDKDNLNRRYHHKIHAVILFDSERNSYVVDVTDDAWIALQTIEAWRGRLPVIEVPEELYDEMTTKGDEPEDGGSGVSEPAPKPDDSGDGHKARVTRAAKKAAQVSAGLNKKLADGDAGVSVPVETPVG